MKTFGKYYYIGFADGYAVDSGYNITRVRQRLMGYADAENLCIYVFKHNGSKYVHHVVRIVKGGVAI